MTPLALHCQLITSPSSCSIASLVHTGDAFEPDANQNAPADPPMQGLARVGSGFAFSTVVQGHQVTAVGEVPAQTVEFIAHSVKATGADLPHH